jgi:hypothetical protein
MPRFGKVLCLALLTLGLGCAQRTLDITSQPSGALVYLNGEEVGRTPVRYYFEWYSNYDVTLRMDGYETLKTQRALKAPLYAIPPFDLCSEMFGVKTKRAWNFVMREQSEVPPSPGLLIENAEVLRSELKSTPLTRRPATRPTTAPTTRPASVLSF